MGLRIGGAGLKVNGSDIIVDDAYDYITYGSWNGTAYDTHVIGLTSGFNGEFNDLTDVPSRIELLESFLGTPVFTDTVYIPPTGTKPITWAELATDTELTLGLSGKADKTALVTTDAAVALNTAKVTFPGHQDISGKAGTTALAITNAAVSLNTLKTTFPGHQNISNKADKTALEVVRVAVAINTAKVTYPGAQDISGKQDLLIAGENITISGNNTISSTGGGGTVDLTDYSTTTVINAALDLKANNTALATTNTAVGLNTAKVTFPGHQDITGKQNTITAGTGLEFTGDTLDAGTSQYQAFRTINGSTLEWDDDVTDVAQALLDEWEIISGSTTDDFDILDSKLRRTV